MTAAKKHKKMDKIAEISDPLDFQIHGVELRSVLTKTPKDFTITTDSYISLCSRVYSALCYKNSGFAKAISESAFQYYATLILWKRFADILASSTTIRSRFCSQIAQLDEVIPFYPIPLQTYLRGIGHFEDPLGHLRRFTLPVFPINEEIGGTCFTFGEVNAETHAFYEAFPAPGIAALRMLADIEYTKNPCEQNLYWNLPKGLRAVVSESEMLNNNLKPTKNLLGWAPAQSLTTSQMKLFETCKIDENFLKNDEFSSELNSSLCKLSKKISLYFSYEISHSITEPRFGSVKLEKLPLIGSITQGMTVRKYSESFAFDRYAMYCEGNIFVSTPYKVNDNLNTGVVIAGYRMPKEPINDRQCWSCYDFNEYTCVPESWIQSRNAIYHYGSAAKFEETLCSTGYIAKRFLQNQCIKYTMFKSHQTWDDSLA